MSKKVLLLLALLALCYLGFWWALQLDFWRMIVFVSSVIVTIVTVLENKGLL